MIKIRKAEKKDLEKVIKLLHQMPKILGQIDFFNKPVKNYSKKHRAHLLRMFEKNVFLVAEEKGTVAGVVLLEIKGKIPILKLKKTGVVREMLVHQDYRRQGIATKLLKAAEKYFKSKKLNFMELSVLTKNQPAFKAYQKCGFEEYRKLMRKKI